jgi:hypothetical protein
MKDKLKILEETTKRFKAYVQCQAVCGDGSGKKVTNHVEGCPYIKYQELGWLVEDKKPVGKT